MTTQLRTIITVRHEREYVVCRNKTVQNVKLSYEATGLLIYLLSLPENWKIHAKTLIREGCGRDKVYRLLNELIAAGHIVVTPQRRLETGRFTPIIYTVYEVPHTENPDTVQPDTVIQDAYKVPKVESTHLEKLPAAKAAGGAADTETNVISLVPKLTRDERNALIDAIAIHLLGARDATGINLNASRASKLLKMILVPGSIPKPEQFPEFVKWYRREYPNASLVTAHDKLPTHWAKFISKPSARTSWQSQPAVE